MKKKDEQKENEIKNEQKKNRKMRHRKKDKGKVIIYSNKHKLSGT